MADFFKRWLVFTKEMDKNEHDREEAYGIENIGRVTTVDKLPLIETKLSPKAQPVSNQM